VLNEHERTVVAYHEMGHALVAMGLPGTDPVHKISIIPRVGALGYTIQRPTEDRFLMTRAELENKMAVLLGGRAAEQLVFGEVSTGAADDLQKVTSIARSIVMRFGMHAGSATWPTTATRPTSSARPPPPQERSYSEETAREIDCAVRQIVARPSSAAGHPGRAAGHPRRHRPRPAGPRTLDEADLKAIHAAVTAA
jgi:cell division protease FtsH